MATSFSDNYQIKLIGTGLESGTWGTSTNQNLSKIEQTLGQAVAINVQLPPAGSTGATAPDWDMTWITVDTAEYGVAGSEGRAKYVEFTSTASNLTAPVTVLVRGSVVGELPNRIYFVRNSINPSSVAATLILDGGAGSKYTVESGACALISINGTSAVGGLTIGTSFNVISNLQIDDIMFSNSASDITIPDNLVNALEIKSTDVNSEFIRLDTVNNHIEIAPGTAVNTIELGATTVTTATQATNLLIKNSETESLEILEGDNSYIKFDTSNKQVLIGEEPSDVETLKIGTTTIDVTTQATAISVIPTSATALTVTSGAETILTFDTNANPEKIITASTSELEVLGTLDVDGTSNFSSEAVFSDVDINSGTIDGVAINTSTIDGTTIGATTASTVEGTTFIQPLANYGYPSGFTFAENGVASAGFFKATLDDSIKIKQTGLGSPGFITSSQMVSSTGSQDTGYFRSEFTFTADNDTAYNIAHNLSSTPSRVEWNLEAIDTNSANYAVGDMVSMTSSWDTNDANGAQITTWKNATHVGWNYEFNGALRIRLVNKTVPSTSTNIDLTNWKLVVEAWE